MGCEGGSGKIPDGARSFTAQAGTGSGESLPGLKKLAEVGGIRLADIGRPTGPMSIPKPEFRRLSPITAEHFHQTPQVTIFEAPIAQEK